MTQIASAEMSSASAPVVRIVTIGKVATVILISRFNW
jgi:hypothetical protein